MLRSKKKQKLGQGCQSTVGLCKMVPNKINSKLAKLASLRNHQNWGKCHGKRNQMNQLYLSWISRTCGTDVHTLRPKNKMIA